MTSHPYDLVLVGGGLQGCLCALAVARVRPEARVAIVEAGDALGGNHTWCFHAADIGNAEARAWIEPAIAHRWDGYDVAFADHARSLDSPYAAVTNESLEHAVRTTAPRTKLLLGRRATAIAPDRVTLDDGTELAATFVVDARGPDRYTPPDTALAYQKFVGLELELPVPHGLTRPMLMDATVSQAAGFRFVYVLPFSPTRVLVEDTYYDEDPALDREALEAGILAYAAAHGLGGGSIVRREHGVLPLPIAAAAPDPDSDVLVAGYAGGWFHPTTGYSFPIALRVAAFVALVLDPAIDRASLLGELRTAHRDQVSFALVLNKMLFRWFPPDQRHYVLSRFYRLPPDTIERFYALTTTRMDRARILVGRPPRGLSWRAMLTGRKAWISAS